MSAQIDDGAGLSFEEFLRFEAAYGGDERFELQGGTVVMMSGGSERHDLMVMALFRVIDPAFAGGPCRVFVHNRKLRTSDRDGWYPDLLVRCGEAADRLYETDARIVVEVLSPSNDPRDRTARLYAYQSLRSVKMILFVDAERRVVTLHERTAEGFWGERQVFDATVEVAGTAQVAVLDVGALWRDVDGAVTRD